MESLIAAHLLKQRTKMDFKTYFQFHAPNKHLPNELKQVEEVKQFMILNGMDETLISKHFKGEGNIAQITATSHADTAGIIGQSQEFSMAAVTRNKSNADDDLNLNDTMYGTQPGQASDTIRQAIEQNLADNTFVSEMASKTIKDFKTRSRSRVLPRVARRINQEERRTKDMQSTISSVAPGDKAKAERKRNKNNTSITETKVMSYD